MRGRVSIRPATAAHAMGRLLIPVISSMAALIIVTAIVFIFAVPGPYLRVGPGPDLAVASVKINTIGRYVALLALIALLEVLQMINLNLADPVFQFNIFNPDKRVIAEYSSAELQISLNIVYLTGALRYAFMVLIQVSQIDIAIFSVVVGRAAGAAMVWWLMRKKRFPGGPAADKYAELV